MIAKQGAPANGNKVLGWREWVALPLLGVGLVKVKVDTGARSCALHAFDLEEFQRDGARWVRFTVHPRQGSDEGTVRVECPLLGERQVKSSVGAAEVRPVVRTEVQVGKERITVDLTLTNRDAMGFRMLLGRSAIRGRFVVDPNRSFVQRRPSRAARAASPEEVVVPIAVAPLAVPVAAPAVAATAPDAAPAPKTPAES